MTITMFRAIMEELLATAAPYRPSRGINSILRMIFIARIRMVLSRTINVFPDIVNIDPIGPVDEWIS